MDKSKLLNQLKEYLNNKNVKYYKDSLNYKGLRNEVPQLNGEKLSLYVVSYMVSINDNQFDSDAIYYAYFDEEKGTLLYIIGPQSYEKIE